MRSEGKRGFLFEGWVGVVAGGCLLLATACERKSPLLGKWVYTSASVAADTNAAGGSERGIEFLPGWKFETFGYQAQGRTTEQYGSYSFVASNRIRLDFEGTRTTEGGTNSSDTKESAGPKTQKFLVYSPDQQQLTAEQSLGEPARFRRSTK